MRVSTASGSRARHGAQARENVSAPHVRRQRYRYSQVKCARDEPPGRSHAAGQDSAEQTVSQATPVQGPDDAQSGRSPDQNRYEPQSTVSVDGSPDSKSGPGSTSDAAAVRDRIASTSTSEDIRIGNTSAVASVQPGVHVDRSQDHLIETPSYASIFSSPAEPPIDQATAAAASPDTPTKDSGDNASEDPLPTQAGAAAAETSTAESDAQEAPAAAAAAAVQRSITAAASSNEAAIAPVGSQVAAGEAAAGTAEDTASASAGIAAAGRPEATAEEALWGGFLRVDNSQDHLIETPPSASLFSGPSEPVSGHTAGAAAPASAQLVAEGDPPADEDPGLPAAMPAARVADEAPVTPPAAAPPPAADVGNARAGRGSGSGAALWPPPPGSSAQVEVDRPAEGMAANPPAASAAVADPAEAVGVDDEAATDSYDLIAAAAVAERQDSEAADAERDSLQGESQPAAPEQQLWGGFLQVDNSQDRLIETPSFASLFSMPAEPEPRERTTATTTPSSASASSSSAGADSPRTASDSQAATVSADGSVPIAPDSERSPPGAVPGHEAEGGTQGSVEAGPGREQSAKTAVAPADEAPALSRQPAGDLDALPDRPGSSFLEPEVLPEQTPLGNGGGAPMPETLSFGGGPEEQAVVATEAEAPEVFNASIAGPIEVASVTAHSTEQALPQEGRPQLRVMWDADSVPYRAPLLAALLRELPGAQVRSLDVFASGANAAALCDPSTAQDRPAGGVLLVDIGVGAQSAAPAATSRMTAHTLHAANDDPSGVYVIVSSDPGSAPVLSTLRMLSRSAIAVTASWQEDATAAAPAVPHGAAWLHITLAGGKPLTTPSAPSPDPSMSPFVSAREPRTTEAAPPGAALAGASTPVQSGGAMQEQYFPSETDVSGQSGSSAQHEPSSSPTSHQAPAEHTVASEGSPAVIPSLPKQHVIALRQFRAKTRSEKYAELSRCLDLMSGTVFSELKVAMMSEPERLCSFDEFPQDLQHLPKFKKALVAGLQNWRTWSAWGTDAVVQMLAAADCHDLNAQLGKCVLDPKTPSFASKSGKKAALAAAACPNTVALGRQLLIEAAACTPRVALTIRPCERPPAGADVVPDLAVSNVVAMLPSMHFEDGSEIRQLLAFQSTLHPSAGTLEDAVAECSRMSKLPAENLQTEMTAALESLETSRELLVMLLVVLTEDVKFRVRLAEVAQELAQKNFPEASGRNPELRHFEGTLMLIELLLQHPQQMECLLEDVNFNEPVHVMRLARLHILTVSLDHQELSAFEC